MRQKPPQDTANKFAARAHIQVRAFPPDLPASAWLKVDEVLQYVPVSRSQWYRGVRDGIFPPPHKVRRLAFWKARDIRVLLDVGPRRARRGKPVKTRPASPGAGPGGGPGAHSPAQ